MMTMPVNTVCDEPLCEAQCVGNMWFDGFTTAYADGSTLCVARLDVPSLPPGWLVREVRQNDGSGKFRVMSWCPGHAQQHSDEGRELNA